MANNPLSTLANIQLKVRRLTRNITQENLSDTDINNYINTFVLYDFPEQLRLFNLRKQFSFYTQPGVDKYDTNTTITTNVLYNFKQNNISVHPPLYIGGFQSFLSQSPEQFYSLFPNLMTLTPTGYTGNNVKKDFSGYINQLSNPTSASNPNNLQPILQNQVLFNSIDLYGNGIQMIDVPIVDSVTGVPTQWGNLYIPGQQPRTNPVATAPYTLEGPPDDPLPWIPDSTNYINYQTGAYTVTFPTAPAAGQLIQSQTVNYVAAQPQTMLFYADIFHLRPVPDKVYKVTFEVEVRPAQLFATSDAPLLEEWWQYIAYGAAIKIFQDRMDTDSVNQLVPEFQNQELICLRRTIMQNSNQRASTIYTEQTGVTSSGWGWGSGLF